MDILSSFLQDDELRMIRVLLADTHLQVRLGTGQPESFATTIGTPQGDSLSPVLFVVYLEAALREVRQTIPRTVAEDKHMPYNLEYADDVGFTSTSLTWLKALQCSIPAIFATWHLTVNVNKTELTELLRGAVRIEEEWRMTRKLR